MPFQKIQLINCMNFADWHFDTHTHGENKVHHRIGLLLREISLQAAAKFSEFIVKNELIIIFARLINTQREKWLPKIALYCFIYHFFPVIVIVLRTSLHKNAVSFLTFFPHRCSHSAYIPRACVRVNSSLLARIRSIQ